MRDARRGRGPRDLIVKGTLKTIKEKKSGWVFDFQERRRVSGNRVKETLDKKIENNINKPGIERVIWDSRTSRL